MSSPSSAQEVTACTLLTQAQCRWCQSPRVELFVTGGTILEGDVPSSCSLLVPQELLTRRSRTFRFQHPSAKPYAERAGPRKITVEGVTPRTAKQFFVWVHARRPEIEQEASFQDVASLGVFAWRFQIPALSNQITDRIRAHLASEEWSLEAGIVDMIYQAAPSGSPLREVIRAALGKVPKSIMEAGSDRDEWRATILKHAELGWDFVDPSVSHQWTANAYLSGVCRFHDHEDVADQKSPSALCDGCPYAGKDCFPASPLNDVEPPARILHDGTAVSSADAVQDIVAKPVDEFLGEPGATPPVLVGQRVGNGIMISDPDFREHKATTLSAIPESATKVNSNSVRPHSRTNGNTTNSNGVIDWDEAVEESNETVTSEDQAEDVTHSSVARTIGTMTERLNGSAADADTAGEKADDEHDSVKMARSRSSKNKKKKRGQSFTVVANEQLRTG